MAQINDISTPFYKLKALKTYASTEWLADDMKKYRQVFDGYKTSYIYADFSFYNKKFDESDWQIDLVLKCYKLKSVFKFALEPKLICELPFKVDVLKDENIRHIREGWGHAKVGAFWTPGTYYWEVWIEEKKVATEYFYVEDFSYRKEVPSKFLELKSLRLYEAPYKDLLPEYRKYSKEFNREETRYIYTEVVLENLHLSTKWNCELFFKFFNEASELKGELSRLFSVERKENTISLSAGWGSEVTGTWRQGTYFVEIVSMDKSLGHESFLILDKIGHKTG